MDKQNLNNQIDNYSAKTEEYLEKGLDMVEKANTMAHNVIDTNFSNIHFLENEEFLQPETAFDYVKSYAIEHPIITTTAVSATMLAGASLLNSKTRKITVPVAKYAIKQQARFTLGVGMLAMATYLTSKNNNSVN